MKRFPLFGAAALCVAGLASAALFGTAASARNAATTTAATTTTTTATTTAGTSSTTSTATATRPKNTAPPAISGKAQVGQLLTASKGSWDGTTPMTYSYQWRVCGNDGGACRDLQGATGSEYSVKPQDAGNTIRVVVTAKNGAGSSSATSVPTAVIAAAAAPAPAPAASGCPKLAAGATSASVTAVSSPARLELDQMQAYPDVITRATRSITLKMHVSSTCGAAIQGADVYLTGVPYNMITIGQATSDANGWATMRLSTLRGFPATPYQQLMVMFVRATKPGENKLAGVSTRRLISFRVALNR